MTKLKITFADNTTAEVQPTLEDRLNFESTLRRNPGWGKLQDNALKLTPFLAWSAASRAKKTSLTWAEFTTGDTAAINVEEVNDEEETDLEVEGLGEDTRPTRSTTSRSSSRAATK